MDSNNGSAPPACQYSEKNDEDDENEHRLACDRDPWVLPLPRRRLQLWHDRQEVPSGSKPRWIDATREDRGTRFPGRTDRSTRGRNRRARGAESPAATLQHYCPRHASGRRYEGVA